MKKRNVSSLRADSLGMVTSPGSRGVIVTLEGQKFRQGTMSAVKAYLISDVRLQHFFIYLVIKNKPERVLYI